MDRRHVSSESAVEQLRLPLHRFALIAMIMWVAFSGSPDPAAAQQDVVVQGQVVDATSRLGLAGISVSLTGRSPVLTDERGNFRIPNVAPGRYALAVHGVGYVPVDMALVVVADTSLVIVLEVAPVPLDTLDVRVGDVTVRGEVHELASGVWLFDAEVFATPDREETTDPIGRFKLSKVPSGVPLTVRVQSFGYLPQTVTIVPQQDTTLEFKLEHDPVVQRMIAEQMKRIDQRSEGRRYAALPLLDRDELLKDLNAPINDVMERRLGGAMNDKVACVIIDENPIRGWQYDTLLPDEIQRVEITEYPGFGRSLMVRVYTRAFVQELVRGKARLVRRELAMRSVANQCR